MVLENTMRLGSSSALQTAKVPWLDIGTIDKTTAEADVALTDSERYYDTVKLLANAVGFKVPFGLNAVEFAFLLDVNNRTADIDAYAVKLQSNDLLFIATLDVVAGAQVREDGWFFADTLTLSNHENSWSQRPVSKGRDDYIRRLFFDFDGCDRVLFHGYGTFDSDVKILLTGK